MPDPTANVISALAAVAADLPGIGKDGRAAATQGGYAYRKMDDLTTAAQPLLAKHGVVFVPQVVSWEIRDITVASKPWTDTILMVRYCVYGPGGLDDCVEAVVVGIGRDNSDKGANKAMTQAFKYALLQVLTVADSKDDADGTTAEADAATESPVPEGFESHEEKSERYDVLRQRIAMLTKDDKALYTAWRDDQGFAFPYTKPMCVAMDAEIDRIVNEAIERVEQGGEAPQEPAGSPARSSATPTGSEAQSGDPGGQDVRLPDPGVLEEATAAVAALSADELRAELIDAGLAGTGTMKDRRARLAVHLALNAPPQ